MLFRKVQSFSKGGLRPQKYKQPYMRISPICSVKRFSCFEGSVIFEGVGFARKNTNNPIEGSVPSVQSKGSVVLKVQSFSKGQATPAKIQTTL